MPYGDGLPEIPRGVPLGMTCSIYATSNRQPKQFVVFGVYSLGPILKGYLCGSD